MSIKKQITELVEQYITTDRASPYNNRRNKLRKIADLLFGYCSEGAQEDCHSYVKRLTQYPTKTKKGLKPTFNSFRGHLSPAVLEEFVMYTFFFSPMMDDAIYNREDTNNAAARWVGDSIDSVILDSFDSLPWGSTKWSYAHDVYLGRAKSKFLTTTSSVEVETKTEIKRGAGMSVVDQIVLEDRHKEAVNLILEFSGGLSVDAINEKMNDLLADAELAKSESSLLATRLASAMSVVSAPTAVSSTGVLPEGNVVLRTASEVFPTGKAEEKMRNVLLNFDVPTFEWEGAHPDVPDVDVNYKFDMTALFRVLQGIVDGNNSYLYGHTGTGKSTLVEQVCAHLKFPLVRVNFDSEISRMDLIGRDTLVTVDGQTVSKFVDGVLPDALSRPCLLLCDEVDFVRPDVMYVFQRVLEGNGLLISEDGGRKVIANPWFRLVATANTVGQGDDTAMYQGARPQSMATLDRFENWVEMGYMKSTTETKWLKGVTGGLTDTAAKLFISYAKEHREAFTSGKIMQPLSPRGLRAMAKRFVTVLGLTNDHKESLREAFEATVLARCTQQDKTILDGLYQRVVG